MLSSSRLKPFPKNFNVLDGKLDSEEESLGAEKIRQNIRLQVTEKQVFAVWV